ncbi:MAG: UDP-N-acetylmuramoyl-L-alanyl-D-glutamate--2,6-diaminopimelate ligase [Pontiella sp.]
MRLNQLLNSIESLGITGTLDPEITGMAYNSGRVNPGGLFVAVPGHKVDGSEFITEALSKGAVAVVSETQLDLGFDIVHVHVPNARKAMADLANVFYGNLTRKMKVVGITGTNGKTTTAYMVRDMLRDGGFLPGLLGTVAYEVGDRSIPSIRTTPEAPDLHGMFLQMKEAGCDAVVLEVSSHALALHRVRGIDFNINVFTNLTQDHLDYHKNMDSYFEVKTTLFQLLGNGPDQAAVINLDDPWGPKLATECNVKASIVTYGFTEEAMVRASEAVVDASGTTFRVSSPWGSRRIKLKLLGRFNIHNALAALAVGGLSGIDLTVMAKSLENIQAIPGRLELVPNRKNKKVFVDYAHTDDALLNVLTTLREICRGQLIVVFGCGGNRDPGKRVKMGHVASELADFSIITSDNPRDEDPGVIASEIIAGYTDQDGFEVVLDRREAIKVALLKIGRKDILLVAGKGHEFYQEFKDTTVPFDDREIVRELIG